MFARSWEKIKTATDSARRIKELAEDIKNLTESSDDGLKLSTESKKAVQDFLETIEAATKTADSTKDIIQETKQIATDEIMGPDKEPSVSSSFKSYFSSNKYGSDQSVSLVETPNNDSFNFESNDDVDKGTEETRVDSNI